MNKTIFVLELVAILAAYLIISMPFAYAALWPKQVLPAQPVEQPVEPAIGFVEIYHSITSILAGLVNSLIPGVKAQQGCIEMGCRSGQYCDIGTNACQRLDSIKLTHLLTEPAQFAGCNQPHTANVTVRIEYPPTGLTFETKAYYLNGSSIPAMIFDPCVQSGDQFKCPITIPSLGSNCKEGTYTLDPNRIELNISFPDNQSTVYKSLSTTFSALTIDSWTCGNRICQTGLGESSTNCCFDCACSTGICDWVSTKPESSASCMPEPTGLTITNKKDQQISGGNWQTTFNVSIPNAPASLTMISKQATVRSCSVEGSGCQITISYLNCQPSDTMPAACNLSFRILSYNPEKTYNIEFNLSFTVHYQNASATITKTLSRTISSSPGRTYCGNLQIDADETASTCCYDVGCSEDSYCDVSDDLRSALAGGQAIPLGDRCKKIDGIVFDEKPIIIRTAAQTAEQPTVTDVETKIGAKLAFDLVIPILNRPATISRLDFKCKWADGLANKGIVCNVKNCKVRGNELNCSIESNIVDFSLFEPTNQGIPGNVLTGTITFNDGPGSVTKALSKEFTINYELKPTCGNGWCETELGEGAWGSGATYPCPADCVDPITGKGCPGKSLTDTIQIGLDKCVNPQDVKITTYLFPDTITCTAAEVGDECMLEDLIFAIAVQHPLGSEISLDDVKQTFPFYIDEQENWLDTNCPSNPHQTFEDGVLLSGFVCSAKSTGLLTPNLLIPGLSAVVAQNRSAMEEGKALENPILKKQIDFNFPFKAYVDGQAVNLTLKKSVNLSINLTDDVTSCSKAYSSAYQQYHDFDKLKNRWGIWATILLVLSIVATLATVTLGIICATTGIACWYLLVVGLFAVGFGIASYLAWDYLDDRIAEMDKILDIIEAARRACNADKFEDIKESLDDMFTSLESHKQRVEGWRDKYKTSTYLFGAAALIGTVVGGVGVAAAAAKAAAMKKLLLDLIVKILGPGIVI